MMYEIVTVLKRLLPRFSRDLDKFHRWWNIYEPEDYFDKTAYDNWRPGARKKYVRYFLTQILPESLFKIYVIVRYGSTKGKI